MRIPVFTSRAQRPSDAPGRSITARMRAEPFVQAELRRGDVLAEALDQVQSYSLMRHKAAVEVQMSESLLAAEEEMMNLANRLKDSTDIYNVFKPDGSGAWSDNVNDMRERLADSIESRSAREQFRARFNQSELSKRFQLRGAIDSRIQARAAAAAAARMQAVEDALSDPFTAQTVDYDMAVMGIRAEEDAAIRNGTATRETTGVMNAQLARNIANRTTLAYVFDDPTRAVALAEALDLQDEVRAGTMTAEQAYAQSGLEDDAAYTLYTLDALPREQALEIIYDTLSRSNRLYEAAERRRREGEERNNAALDRNYRGMFIFTDPTKEFDFGDLMMVAPSVAAQYSARLAEKGVSVTTDTPITADDARTAFIDYFDMRNYLTPEQRRTIDTAFNRPPASSFATETNADVYTDLFARAEAGNLTVAGLNSARGSITSENFTLLLGKIGAEADDALNDAKSVVRLRFGYDERMAMDTEGARQAQAAYFSVASQLEQTATQRRAEGNPMTRTELNNEAQRLAEQQLELFRTALRGDRDQYIELSMSNIPGIGYGDPLADLEAWWTSLDEAGQRSSRADYARHRFTLLDYQNRMNR
jgi:hypothetical protein